MSFPVICPGCGVSGTMPNPPVGQSVTCPRCKGVFVPPRIPVAPMQRVSGPPGADPAAGIWVDSPNVLDITGAALTQQPQLPVEPWAGALPTTPAPAAPVPSVPTVFPRPAVQPQPAPQLPQQLPPQLQTQLSSEVASPQLPPPPATR